MRLRSRYDLARLSRKWTAILGLVLCAAPPAVARQDVLTDHADRTRSGWYRTSKDLGPERVAGFGKLWESRPFDPAGAMPPRLYASPLYLDGLKLGVGPGRGRTLKVVIAATSSGDVYAINAAPATRLPAGSVLWARRLEAPCTLRWDASAMGVLGTPIIDRARRTLYVSACAAEGGFRVFALDLATGQPRSGWPVRVDEAVLEGVDANPSYDPGLEQPLPASRFYIQRGALNLSPDDHYLYLTLGQARGWVVAVDTQRGRVASAFSSTPIRSDSTGGIWAAAGVSVDARGRVFAVTGASANQAQAERLRNWSQSVLKFDPMGPLGWRLRGVYTPFNYCRTGTHDVDLASSGATLIAPPDGQALLAAVGGKQGNAYLLGSSSFRPPGSERRACSDDPTSDLSLLAPGPQPQFGRPGPINLFGPYSDDDGMLDRAKARTTPAYFRDARGREFLIFVGSGKDPRDTRLSIAPGVVRLRIERPARGHPYLKPDGTVAGLVLQNPGSPVVTSNGGRQAVIWVLDENAPRSAALTGQVIPRPVLYAIDADSMRVVWRSEAGELQTSGKYNAPVAAGGLVFVGTDRIVAFGPMGRPGKPQIAATSPRSSPPAGSPPPGPALVAATDETWPDLVGRDFARRACSACHDPGIVARQRLTPHEWADMVDVMTRYGAALDADDRAQAVDYLSRAFPAPPP